MFVKFIPLAIVNRHKDLLLTFYISHIALKLFDRCHLANCNACAGSNPSDHTPLCCPYQLSPQDAALFSSRDIAMPVSSSLWSLVWYSSCRINGRLAGPQFQEKCTCLRLGNSTKDDNNIHFFSKLSFQYSNSNNVSIRVVIRACWD